MEFKEAADRYHGIDLDYYIHQLSGQDLGKVVETANPLNVLRSVLVDDICDCFKDRLEAVVYASELTLDERVRAMFICGKDEDLISLVGGCDYAEISNQNLLYLAKANYRQGYVDKAVEIFEVLINRGFIDAYFDFANLLREQGYLDDANETMLLGADQGCINCMVDFFQITGGLHTDFESIKSFDDQITLASIMIHSTELDLESVGLDFLKESAREGSLFATRQLFDYYLQHGQFSAALKYHRILCENGFYATHADLGNYYYQSGNVIEAMEEYRKGYEMGYEVCGFNYVELMLSAKNFGRLLEFLDECIEMKLPNAYLLKGYAYKNRSQGIEDRRQALDCYLQGYNNQNDEYCLFSIALMDPQFFEGEFGRSVEEYFNELTEQGSILVDIVCFNKTMQSCLSGDTNIMDAEFELSALTQKAPDHFFIQTILNTFQVMIDNHRQFGFDGHEVGDGLPERITYH